MESIPTDSLPTTNFVRFSDNTPYCSIVADPAMECQKPKYKTMKQTIIALATIIVAFIQAYFLGINGLTILTIPMTIFLGLEVIENTTRREENTTNK